MEEITLVNVNVLIVQSENFCYLTFCVATKDEERWGKKQPTKKLYDSDSEQSS